MPEDAHAGYPQDHARKNVPRMVRSVSSVALETIFLSVAKRELAFQAFMR